MEPQLGRLVQALNSRLPPPRPSPPRPLALAQGGGRTPRANRRQTYKTRLRPEYSALT